jgi:hypothetical protein
MEEVRFIWAGPLDSSSATEFRSAAVAAIDRAHGARVPLSLDLGLANVFDLDGYYSIVALARSARSLGVPVRIDRLPLMVRLELASADLLGLFEWPDAADRQ